ncbi:sugar nucleotide-binding protein [Halopseudomonas salegens]|uniref:dTDP-4-dehydrorhamnose reductase n=1 Tax=Halopseudomonas salegens TaxID=1434072 RepID=A0A1H2EGX1_9GAMM|nr:sugar nucleotide-binding protein [Halopseudomonas salegens]SDT94243.1 dTDP-4-dehydrorhamnose reductase [Halopseudomonas salegens]
MRKRVMLVGAETTLGQELEALAAMQGVTLLARSCPAAGWDAAELNSWLDQDRPDVVVNLAHFHQQFQCDVPAVADLQHLQAFHERLMEAATAHGCWLLMLSSARVFDGEKTTPYAEKDEVAPLDALGRLQHLLESELRRANDRHLILRLSWVLDNSADGHLQRLRHQLCAGDSLALAKEWRGNPTPVADVARVIFAMLRQVDCAAAVQGTYHYGSVEASSWISLAKSLAQELLASGELEQDPVIIPAPFFEQSMAGHQPQNAALTHKRLMHVFGIKPRPWRAQLVHLLAS